MFADPQATVFLARPAPVRLLGRPTFLLLPPVALEDYSLPSTTRAFPPFILCVHFLYLRYPVVVVTIYVSIFTQ